MRLTGECPSCNGQHAISLAVDAEVDMDSVVMLSSTVGPSGDVPASPELIRALIDAGVMHCPVQRRRDTLGATSHGFLTT